MLTTNIINKVGYICLEYTSSFCNYISVHCYWIPQPIDNELITIVCFV